MPNRADYVFKTVCVLLAALVLVQVVRLFRIPDPLETLDWPSLAVLAVETNVPPATTRRESNTPPTMAPGGMNERFPAGLASNVQDQINVILQSEILGSLPRPQPLLLLGIAGEHALLQTPTGQSGLAAEGETLGGIKVIQIGTNRVLVEVEGRPQELILFPGLPGESLLPNTQPPRP